MTANNKALLVMVAVVAFVVGTAVNSASVSDNIDSQQLLQARLIQGDTSASIGDQLGKLTLVNFWASWCAPCREEMPVFETLYRSAKDDGFQIIGVAIDSPEKAQPMLDSMDITYPILYAEMAGMAVMDSAGNPQGLLPYSLLLNEDGQIIDQVLGTVDAERINAWLNKYL